MQIGNSNTGRRIQSSLTFSATDQVPGQPQLGYVRPYLNIHPETHTRMCAQTQTPTRLIWGLSH